MAVKTAVAWPAASLGPMLQDTDRLAFVAAVVVFASLACRIASGWWPALAVSVALFWLPASGATFGLPLNVGLFIAAVACACLVGVSRARGTRQASATTARALAAMVLLAASAAMAPAMTIPMGIVAIVVATMSFAHAPWHRRVVVAVAGAAGVFLAAWAARALLPATAGPDHLAASACTFGPAATPLRTALALVALEIGHTPPYVLALAGLGAFCLRGRVFRTSMVPLMLFVLAPVAATIVAPVDLRSLTFAPTIAIWLMAAAGISEAMAACRRSVAGRASAVLLLVLVPLLTWSAHAAVEPIQIQSGGHGALSLNGVVALRAQLPIGSVLVREDAVTDALLHASVEVLRNTNTHPEIVPLEPAAIAAKLTDQAIVYALPDAQRLLRGAGFVLADPRLRDISGVARVTRGGQCVSLRPAPAELSQLAGAVSVALSAPTTGDVGPIVAYLSLDAVESTRPVDWPSEALRGYHVDGYGTTEADRARLANDLELDGLRSDWLSTGATRVVRLELWRTPTAPRSLPVDLGARVVSGTGRLTSTGTPQRLQVCPVTPFDVQPLRVDLFR